MKTTVTVYRNGEIDRQFEVVGFKKGLAGALVFLDEELTADIVHLRKDCKVECSFLMRNEWSCTITHNGDEVFGLTVEESK